MFLNYFSKKLEIKKKIVVFTEQFINKKHSLIIDDIDNDFYKGVSRSVNNKNKLNILISNIKKYVVYWPKHVVI